MSYRKKTCPNIDMHPKFGALHGKISVFLKEAKIICLDPFLDF